MTLCTSSRFVEFKRKDRDFVTWGSQGLSEDAVASFQIEGTGPLYPLEFDPATGVLAGYFAGPDFGTPGPAHVITQTVHIDIYVTDGDVTRWLDGGFIRLVN